MSSKHMKPHHGLPVALAADGCSIATVNGNDLAIFQTSDAHVVRTTRLHNRVKGRLKFLQWSKSGSEQPSLSINATGPSSHRLLCASSNHISVLDLHDEAWSAEVDAGDGASFTHVEFSANPNEVLALSEFGLQLTVFLLETGEQRVIKWPKFSSPNTYALRPTTGHLAVLLKLDAGDVLTIHELGTYEAIATANIPVVDAQGLRWSPNGAWLAIWDAASAGTKVVVYTADGQYFRSYARESDDHDFGVKTVEWSPDSRLLAIGRHDGTVELINGSTFTLAYVLGDPTTVRPIGRDIYLESASGLPGDRQYNLVPESPVFPYTYNTHTSSRVVSTISFNPSSSFIATVDQGLPHIVWMWSVSEGRAKLAGALVQMSSVRQLLWHPRLPELLMATNDEDAVYVHQWICGHVPRVAPVPNMTGGKHCLSWVRPDEPSNGVIWAGSPSGYAVGYVTGAGPNAEFSQIACLEDGHQPLDAEDFPLTE